MIRAALAAGTLTAAGLLVLAVRRGSPATQGFRLSIRGESPSRQGNGQLERAL
ncbi:hypothetical protein [Actinomadura mexicana]|uniref:Uncharacterized protein n=1 Tax=Actinomadura mexicana TaxID=134959 RepID=A0A238X873_9ACTN|nr:hypothetical protein [Actinomadura mexicana]SNR54910.1 hypothetical protein SAMN06265355_10452 [Actinomadura mexicana]